MDVGIDFYFSKRKKNGKKIRGIINAAGGVVDGRNFNNLLSKRIIIIIANNAKRSRLHENWILFEIFK